MQHSRYAGISLEQYLLLIYWKQYIISELIALEIVKTILIGQSAGSWLNILINIIRMHVGPSETKCEWVLKLSKRKRRCLRYSPAVRENV